MCLFPDSQYGMSNNFMLVYYSDYENHIIDAVDVGVLQDYIHFRNFT